VRALDPDEVPPLPTTDQPFIKRPGRGDGDVSQHLEGSAGLVDAPADASKKKPAAR
jgi:hypothetical protein